jgi:light-regulated signal transduction histidine kinase (bacteriophytochrome)
MIGDAVRASQVVERIRALAKNTPPQKVWLNINETVEETIALTRTELKKSGTAVKTQLSNDVPVIWADRIQLQQVILNLIINAIESVSEVSDGTRDLFISTAKGEPDGVLFTIADSAKGLPPRNSKRSFTPSIQLRARVWAWDWRSAVRSSSHMAAVYGQRRTSLAGQSFVLHYRMVGRRHTDRSRPTRRRAYRKHA